MTGAWRDDAACRVEDARLFDPIHQESDEALAARTAAAKAICARCPVVEPCREAGRGESGVFAGVLLNNGRPVGARAKRGPKPGPRALMPCGTRAAYERHVIAGEQIDDDCRMAARAYKAKHRRSRYKADARTRWNAA